MPAGKKKKNVGSSKSGKNTSVEKKIYKASKGVHNKSVSRGQRAAASSITSKKGKKKK
jgi:hypothetical protein